MKLQRLLSTSLVLMTASHLIAQEVPRLARKGITTQLIVDGKPFLMLAGELHNSSSSGLGYMQALWPRLKAMNLNTVLAAVSWELTEPEEGKFDFTLVDGLIQQARAQDMRLVLLWFGSWKNGVSSYVPEWVRRDTVRFPRALGASNRNTKDILSTLSEANLKADANAYAMLMKHLREFDGEKRTVILMQVENEVGIKPEPRDLSPEADEVFNGPVPEALMKHLQANKEKLIPELRALWEKGGFKSTGTWSEVFGEGPQAAEVFSAWHYARYVNEVTKAGKARYPLPMYVNAWLRGPNDKIGTYPTGGPVAHVMDIWQAAAPDIDFISPDIYLPDFKGICKEYTQRGNPLFIPEASIDNDAVARAFWAIGQHGAMGFAPFGIDRIDPPAHPLTDGYAALRQLIPFITAAHGTGRMIGIYRQDRSIEKEPPLIIGDYRVNVTYARRLPNSVAPFGIVIQTGDEEFIVAGYGFDVNFSATKPGKRSTGIAAVEMGRFENGAWRSEMRLNGDETGGGHVAKLPPNTGNAFLDPTKVRILKVKVYRYE